MNYLYAALGWTIWCTLHSVLISITITEYMKIKLRDGFRFYRLFFNTFSLVTLAPVLYYSLSIQQEPIFRWEGPLVIIRYLLIVASSCLFIAGAWNYSISQFLGIRQIKNDQATRSLSGYDTFVTSGIHRMIRHPWYLGGMMIVWAGDMGLSTIMNNIVITSYFIIGTILEERKLVHEFGEQFREYQRSASMFFPWKWLKIKIIGVLHTLRA